MGIPSRVAFLDLSHYVFHRYHSIHTWCRVQNFKITDDGEFLERFDRLFMMNLQKLVKKFASSWKHFHIVKDCFKDEVWRMEIYPEYKKNRSDREKDPLVSKIFKYVYEVLLPRLVDVHQANIIGYAKAEADDVIAVLVQTLRQQHSSCEIVIITNDTDYLQLIDENTRVVNSQCVDIKNKIDPQVIQRYTIWKIIRGDPSDNIPPIDNRIGAKMALKLACDASLLASRLQANQSMRARFELNNRLINFNCIPADMRNAIAKLLPYGYG